MAPSPERRNRFAPTPAVRRAVEATSTVDQRLSDQTVEQRTVEPVTINTEQKPTEFVKVNRFCRRKVSR